jgi:hypothetical protein
MPLLTLKFFEQQRSSRAVSMQRFQEDFVVQTELLDDIIAQREICLWQGRIAMVPFETEGFWGSQLEFK